MAVVRRPTDGAILVQRDTGADRRHFERLLGGHVEFGERAEQAVRRELREEIGQEIRDVRLVQVLENLFTLDGAPGHEIVFVFEAGFVDAGAYDIEEQAILDDPTGRIRVAWRAPEDDSVRLVPDGIDTLLGLAGASDDGRPADPPRSRR
jgi:ADP-ribose pyrophosphatase YjhB (NUDIX family)